MLEPRPLLRAGGAGQRLEAPVDLERIRRHRHRPLAELAQPPRQLDRDMRLADAGRAEQRDHLRPRHGPQYGEAMSAGAIG